MQKKIRKEARRTCVSVDDLANAVSSVQYEKQGNYVDAEIYKDMISTHSEDLMDTARYVVQFMSDLEAMPDK